MVGRKSKKPLSSLKSLIFKIIEDDGTTLTALAEAYGTQGNNVGKRLQRQSLTVADLKKIGDILGYDVSITYTGKKDGRVYTKTIS